MGEEAWERVPTLWGADAECPGVRTKKHELNAEVKLVFMLLILSLYRNKKAARYCRAALS